MSFVFGLAIYFVLWWVVLFAILPFGIKTQAEAGHIEPGTEESAPIAPHLPAKLAATTVVSGVVFGLFYWIFVYEIIGLDDIPFLPRFDDAAELKPQ